MVILDNYRLALLQADIREDPQQMKVVQDLQDLYEQVVALDKLKPNRSVFLPRIWRKKTAISNKGLYLWGGVGRGKTWLMDVFYQSVPSKAKLRFHFHQFMHFVHTELAKLKGQRDPLKLVAAKVARNCRILCIDEFHVADITDAMLLYGLLDALFVLDIVLVATSNQEPDDLYKNGLQRSRFLPAIELLKSYTKVVNLEGDNDYRCTFDIDSERYITPMDEYTIPHLQKLFKHFHPGDPKSKSSIHINNRPIDTMVLGDGVIWFDFESLCGTARATTDYIEIAKKFPIVLLSSLPVFTDEQDDKARRFVKLIDAFYDNKTHLIVAADVEPQYLYVGRQLTFEFTRTVSRLIEMRSRSFTNFTK